MLSLLYQPAFTQEFDLSILQHGGAVDRAYVENLKSSLTRLAPLVLRPGDLQLREEKRRDTTPTTDDVWRTLGVRQTLDPPALCVCFGVRPFSGWRPVRASAMEL